MDDRDWIDRAFALVVASVVIDLVLGPTQVPLNFWFMSGTLAIVLGFAYLVALAVVALDPKHPGGHIAATTLGVAFWLGRAGGFLSFIFSGKTYLFPAAHERLAWVLLIVMWHVRAIRLIPIRNLINTVIHKEESRP